MKKVYESIRKARTAKDFSQEYMAEMLGISQRQYSRLENGESEMTLSYLDKISKTLDIKLDDLFSDVIQENNNQNGGLANAANIIINETSEKLIGQYEQRLKDKDSEIEYLRKLLDKK